MRILVVEDDRLLNNTLCYNLSAAGYEVDAALTKSVAERFCRKQEYDLIVLDICRTEMGLIFAGILRTATRTLL